ncbi:helix-turn-helix domain-containing protein [Ensifer adhaerens]|uniref:helix-turn-helix domain-containing protein n=1 Tax=Ensifer adhaerens TaxID=106592 RepID=UPI000CF150F7|nr:helix-turn-helix transcriptional regulator [Ensifer adhaerens]
MTDDWRARLGVKIDESGQSYRSLSAKCGFGPNFVSEFMAGGKAPSADRVVKLADVLNVSLAYIFTGVEMSREDEDFLRLVAAMPDDQKRHLRALLEKQR